MEFVPRLICGHRAWAAAAVSGRTAAVSPEETVWLSSLPIMPEVQIGWERDAKHRLGRLPSTAYV